MLIAFLFPSAAVFAGDVILFIGDGMGAEHVKAAGMYLNGSPGTLAFESFPHQAHVLTASADNDVTDSAAAATAMSTGRKVNRGVISKAIPGGGENLETLVEYFAGKGKRTGLVTTTFITHATPAAFAAHTGNRSNYNDIADDYLNNTRPDVLFGGGGRGMNRDSEVSAEYTVVDDRTSLTALKSKPGLRVSGQFGRGHTPFVIDRKNTYPDLPEMTKKALQILDNGENGFFLMVEGGLIDHAAHANHIHRVVTEIIEFSEAVEIALKWRGDRSDILILVTADHETGGLKVIKNNGKGKTPVVEWATNHHTSAPVPAYAVGKNSEQAHGILDNTDIHDILKLASEPLKRPDKSAADTSR